MANPPIHWELTVVDVERSKAFYGKVFDWTYSAMGPEYTLIGTGGVGGGLMAKPPGAPNPALNVYFQVTEIDKTLRSVVEAGGRVVVPRTEIPTVGWYAMFLDPDGVAVGVLQPLSP